MSLTAMELILIAAGVLAVYAIYSTVRFCKSPKGTDRDAVENMVRENAQIVDAYARYIEANPSGGGIIFDVARLPRPKQVIQEALLMQSLYEPDANRFGCLGAMLIGLAEFQEGVGPEPLFATGVDPRRGFDMSDSKALAKQIATYPHRERYKQFEALQNKDVVAFQEMITKVSTERGKRGLRCN